MPDRLCTDIVEDAIGGVAFLALHVGTTQAHACELADDLERRGLYPGFVEALRVVAGFEVRL